MDYMGNRSFWNDKFLSRTGPIMKEEEQLKENLSMLKRHRLLDLASGDGRNAIYLLKEGFVVTAVDFSEAALDRLKAIVSDAKLSVKTVQMDLSNFEKLETLGIFDSIVINHYRLAPEAYGVLSKLLSDGGTIFVSGFGPSHETDKRIKKTDLILKEDFKLLKEDFECLLERSFEVENRGSFVTYIFKKDKKNSL